jgi:bacillithiol biosynthesis cysteine-adding enzyme BshC
MSTGLRIERTVFGGLGSLGAGFAAGDRSATDLFPGLAGGLIGSGRGSNLPKSCDESALGDDAFGATSAEAAAKLGSILSGEGALVATGHQPCLFLGPLFVLYKALTTIELAKVLEERLDLPVLPLFWVASDDHDWEEVGTTRLIDTNNELRTFRLDPPRERERRSVGESILDESIVGPMAELRQALPESAFVARYLEWIERSYEPGLSMGQAFGRLLAGVLSGRKMVWLDSAAASVKRALVPLHRRALSDAAAATAAVTSSTQRVRDAGFEAQLTVPARASNVFYDDGEARRRVYVEGETVSLGRDGEPRELEALLEELDERPEAFGPSAALRPVAESCLLPVAASVLGPSEIAYWAQLPDLFTLSGVGLPLIVPRTTWQIREGKVEKVLRTLEIAPGELRDGGSKVLRRAVREARPAAVGEALKLLEESNEAAFDRVREALVEEMPGIQTTADKARARAVKVSRDLERAIDGAVREREALARQKIEKAALHLYPGGKPQERVQSPFYFLARYGEEFLNELDRQVRATVEEYVARLDA